MKQRVSGEELPSEEIDLGSILSIVWKRWKFIVLGTLSAALLSTAISFSIPKQYRSEGFYQLGNPTKKIVDNERYPTKKIANTTKLFSTIGIPIPIYKSSSTQFFNINRLHLLFHQDKTFDEAETGRMKINLKTAGDIHRWIKPVYAFAKEDAREFSQLPQDESNSVIGLNLSYEAQSPKIAYDYVNFFGNYIRDCLLYTTLYNYIGDGYSNTIAQLKKIENEIINVKFDMLQHTNKASDIRAILSTYPQSANIENRQLVSIQEGGDRYLSPITQLVGIESTLADLRRMLSELERNYEKSTVISEYFTRCYNELIKDAKTGESLFNMIKSMKDETFKNRNIKKDQIKEVFNQIDIDQQMFSFTFFQNSRFISGPTIPSGHVSPRKAVIIAAVTVVAFFSLIVWVFISHWWHNNKNEVLSGSTI